MNPTNLQKSFQLLQVTPNFDTFYIVIHLLTLQSSKILLATALAFSNTGYRSYTSKALTGLRT